ncbi:hypothetical protein AVEN_185088-1 [Araneus ventricosus]|uniref:Tc1-like transposase DDE domain-containing protein n=1 Tax=Araneus ventricosus TaxID=182803 RepID=A0A4Y2TIN4_ARAVE|nr:hypothetical protein AVEN_185088-1 [Araneus ventricosus]
MYVHLSIRFQAKKEHKIPAFSQVDLTDRHVIKVKGIIAIFSILPWPSRSPDLNPYDSWLWGYLKDVVFSTPIAHLAELKARITQHILNVTPETLRSVVEHAVSRFQLVAENGGQHIEHVLNQSREI